MSASIRKRCTTCQGEGRQARYGYDDEQDTVLCPCMACGGEGYEPSHYEPDLLVRLAAVRPMHSTPLYQMTRLEAMRPASLPRGVFA